MSVTKTATEGALGLAVLLALVIAVGAAQSRSPVRGGETPADSPPVMTAECLDCHEELWDVIEAEVPHAPAQAEECALCHEPHAARFPKLLNLRERALCAKCHGEEVTEFMKGSVHTPILKGECGSCHEVHGSSNEALLVAVGNELCFRCHEDKHAQQTLPSVHEPFGEGECSDCHQPHNAPHPDLLPGPANALCGLCHQSTDELTEAHWDIPVQGTRCVTCHDAHASTTDGLLLPVVHQPFGGGDCDLCHQTDSETPRLLRGSGARLCQVCHEEVPRPADTLVHQPIAEGDCRSCHLPHAGRNAGLLVGSELSTCLSCHEDVQRRADESRTAHPMAFDDASCTACHQPHSSTEEWLLSQGPIRTCLNCHETQRHGHPLGTDRLDPRTGEPITCVTCHDVHGTDFSYQLRGDQSRGLCIECHNTERSGGH